MGRLRTEPSIAKPSPPDAIIELRPPAETGSTMTHKIRRSDPPPFDLQFFLSKGYTIVESDEDPAA